MFLIWKIIVIVCIIASISFLKSPKQTAFQKFIQFCLQNRFNLTSVNDKEPCTLPPISSGFGHVLRMMVERILKFLLYAGRLLANATEVVQNCVLRLMQALPKKLEYRNWWDKVVCNWPHKIKIYFQQNTERKQKRIQ